MQTKTIGQRDFIILKNIKIVLDKNNFTDFSYSLEFINKLKILSNPEIAYYISEIHLTDHSASDGKILKLDNIASDKAKKQQIERHLKEIINKRQEILNISRELLQEVKAKYTEPKMSIQEKMERIIETIEIIKNINELKNTDYRVLLLSLLGYRKGCKILDLWRKKLLEFHPDVNPNGEAITRILIDAKKYLDNINFSSGSATGPSGPK